MSPLPGTAPHPPSGAELRLERAIGPWTLAATAVNLTVGAGIFMLPAVVAAMLGSAAILAYLVCGGLMLLVLACFAEVGSQVSRSGGAVAYVEAAFGPFAGFLAWAVFSLGFSVAADAAIANVLLDTLAGSVPALAGGPPRVLVMLALFGGLAAINVRGVRQGARVAVATTVAKVLPLLLVIVLGAAAADRGALAWPGWPTAAQLGAASLVLFFAFAGAESALTPSGEIRDPARTVPRGILGGAAGVLALYVALQLTTQAVLGDDLARHAGGPLAEVAARVAGPTGRAIILASVAVAVFGTLSADMMGAPRAFLAAAESGLLPARLATVHPRFRTPWVAIVAFATLTLLLAVSGGFRPLAVLSSMALLLVYLAVCLAVLRLRRTTPRSPGAFRLPGGPAIPLLAAATVLWLLAQSTRAETGAMAALLAAASLYYVLRRRMARPGPSPSAHRAP